MGSDDVDEHARVDAPGNYEFEQDRLLDVSTIQMLLQTIVITGRG